MQRIPNPGSDLTIFVRIFRELHQVLSSGQDFGLDDITRAMIERKNVTSQGAVGAEALKRSTRADRSRDPLYNQSKMYAELYRTLGWIQSTTSKLTYSFTLLGEHVAIVDDPSALVKECLLGIAYPNEVLGVQSDQIVRVIGTILLALDALGSITRDELMAGPMSISDDTNPAIVDEMLATLKRCRANAGALDKVIDKITLQRGISRSPTMENYTRLPMAVFPWAGWATKARLGVLVITEAGKVAASHLRNGLDIRLKDFERLPEKAKPAFIRLTFYRMLGRAGFLLDPVAAQLNVDEATLKKHGTISHKGDFYFSPFQQLSRDSLLKWAPDLIRATVETIEEARDSAPKGTTVATTKRTNRFLLDYSFSTAAVTLQNATELLAQEVRSAYNVQSANPKAAVEALALHYQYANQDIFYPLVANLFCMLGFDCKTSRRGSNYSRADAVIFHPSESIPIEIKSPGEEYEISVKGVRQALENKVVMLSRKSFPTTPATTSLVVGYNAPSERSEVHELITDIWQTFGVRIGIIDFRSLLFLALRSAVANKGLVIPDLSRLQGVIRV